MRNRQDYLTEAVGPIPIRIETAQIGNIPTFPVGTVGTFKCKWKDIDLLYCAVNARVTDSKPGDLLLEAYSLDAYTNPISMTRD